MAATTHSLPDASTPLDAHQATDATRTIPSPAQVRATAAAIRRAWTPTQRRRRAQLASSLLWQIAAGELPDAKR